MTALADTDDLAVVLGYTPDEDRASRLWEMASVEVERYVGRAFTYEADDTVTVTVGRSGTFWLPNGPVTAVDSITTAAGDVVDPDTYEFLPNGDVRLTLGTWTVGVYEVVYSHGYQTIPDDVIKAVCELVAVDLGGPTVGYQSETLGDWSGTASTTARSEILERLRRYRRLVGRIEVL